MRSKYGLQIFGGLVLFVAGIFQLPLHLDGSLSSIFTVLWLSVTSLYVISNLRRVMKIHLFNQLQRERARREKWLQAQQQLMNQRRRKVKAI